MRAVLARFVFGRIALFALIFLVLGALAPGMPAAARTQRAPACAAVGSYTVGPTAPSPQAGVPHPGATTSAAVVFPVFGYTGVLSGTMTLASYTGCGTATVGAFAVHAVYTQYHGPLPQRPGGTGVRVPKEIAIPLLLGTSVLTATGTFTQDPAHPTDPAYLLIDATVTYGRQGFSCSAVCPQAGTGARSGGSGARIACPATGCEGTTIVTRTTTFSKVTGFLRLQMGTHVLAGLVFLPPPDPNATNATAAMTVQPVTFTATHT